MKKLNPGVLLIVVILGVYIGLKINNVQLVNIDNFFGKIQNVFSGIQTVNETTTPKIKEVGIGEVLQVDNVLFRVNEVSSQKSLSDGFFSYNADGTYLIVSVSLKNAGNEAITTDSSFFEIHLEDKKYSPTTLLSIDDQFMFDGLNPDISKSGIIFFDVPEEVAKSDELILNVKTGFWGTEQGEINLK